MHTLFIVQAWRIILVPSRVQVKIRFSSVSSLPSGQALSLSRHYTRSFLAYVEGLELHVLNYPIRPTTFPFPPEIDCTGTGTWVLRLGYDPWQLRTLLLSLAPRTSPSSDRALLGLQPMLMLIPAILDRKKSRQEQPVLTIASTPFLLPLR